MAINTSNEYALALGELFEQCPKAVFAAIAVSALTVGGDYLEEAPERVAAEWQALSDAQVVPQRPTKLAQTLAAKANAMPWVEQ